MRSGVLKEFFEISNLPYLTVKECRLQNGWDVNLIKHLMGKSTAEEILDSMGEHKEGANFLIGKSSLNSMFSSKIVWDCVRVKAPKSE